MAHKNPDNTDNTKNPENTDAGGDTGKIKAADIQVLSGNPNAEEIAALVAALSALASKAETEALKPHTRWAEPMDMLRLSPHSWQLITLIERGKLARPRGAY